MANDPYSILFRKEYAHNEPIYCCDWIKANIFGDSVKVSKDIIATGGLDGLVKVWTIQNNRLEPLYILPGHAMGVMSVAVNPTAAMVVSASLDSNIILWDVNAVKKITEIPTGESDVWKLAFSPCGTQIATGGHKGKIYLYEVKDGVIHRMLDTREKFILSLDWSPDGKYIAAGSDNGTVCILDSQQGKVVHTIEAHSLAIRSIVFSPCSNRVATASNDGFVKIYGVISAGLQCKFEHKSWLVSVCFAPDGTRVAIGTGDGKVFVARAHDLSIVKCFDEHIETVWGVSFDSFSKRLISVSKDGSMNLYDCPSIKK